MKPLTTIATATAAWDILRKANLHHFLDVGVANAIQRLSELNINLSDLISDLLAGGVLVEFLAAITASPCYLDASGEKTPWEDLPFPIIGELISDFFTDFGSAFKVLMRS